MRGWLLAIAACTAAPVAQAPAPPPPVVVARPVDPVHAAIADLHDPQTAAQAVTRLEALGDPRAIGAIGEAWLANGRDPGYLDTIILLALHGAVLEVAAGARDPRGTAWGAARVYLERAVAEIDEQDPHSIDGAVKAVRGLAQAGILSPVVVDLATSPARKRLAPAQLAAIASLGHLPGGTPTLIAIVSRPRPTGVTAEENELYLGAAGSAVNGLATRRDPAGIEPLLVEMYRAPELFGQIRRALIAIGPAVLPIARRVLRGEVAAVEAVHPDESCDASGCKPTGTRDFFVSEVLADQPDPASVPDLVAALARPAQPAWYRDGAPSKSSQQVGIAIALGQIGAPEAATPLRARWHARETALRARAIDAYAHVALDGAALPELRKLVADATGEVRERAALAIGMLSRDPKDFAPIAAWVKVLEKSASADDRTKAHGFADLAAAIATAAQCRDDVDCYAQVVARSSSDANASGMAMTRAMYELAKRHAIEHVPQILPVIEREASEYVKLGVAVLARIAPRPCPDCAAAIEKAIARLPASSKGELEIARERYR